MRRDEHRMKLVAHPIWTRGHAYRAISRGRRRACQRRREGVASEQKLGNRPFCSAYRTIDSVPAPTQFLEGYLWRRISSRQSLNVRSYPLRVLLAPVLSRAVPRTFASSPHHDNRQPAHASPQPWNSACLPLACQFFETTLCAFHRSTNATASITCATPIVARFTSQLPRVGSFSTAPTLRIAPS
jgi:hypothetical protein